MFTDSERALYRNSRPAKRMGSGALIRDAFGRVLLVQPTYKPGWEIPGGAVEVNESPRDACARELTEELGMTFPLGRMLCVEWQGLEADRTESLMFLYDGGVIDPAEVRVAAEELKAFQFVDEAELDVYLVERLAVRIRAALTALASGVLAELENGRSAQTSR